MAQYVRNRSNFINPYNFVPVDLRNTGRANVAKRSEELLTGYFQCRVRCRTRWRFPMWNTGKIWDGSIINIRSFLGTAVP